MKRDAECATGKQPILNHVRQSVVEVRNEIQRYDNTMDTPANSMRRGAHLHAGADACAGKDY